MIIAMPETEVEKAIAVLNAEGEKAWRIGSIVNQGADGAQVTIA